MGFGFGSGSGSTGEHDWGGIFWSVVIVILILGMIIAMSIASNSAMSQAYKDKYGDTTPIPATVAASIKAPLYDGDDGRQTVRVQLLLRSTDDNPESGTITNLNEAVNYLYYGRGKQQAQVTVTGLGKTSPVVTIIGPDGAVLAQDDNDGGASQVAVQTELPTEGYYTVRVSANAIGPGQNGGSYSLEFTPFGSVSALNPEQAVQGILIVLSLAVLIVVLLAKLFHIPIGTTVKDAWTAFLIVLAGASEPAYTPPRLPRHTIAMVQYPPPTVPPEDATRKENTNTTGEN